jgi:hypothetical protein
MDQSIQSYGNSQRIHHRLSQEIRRKTNPRNIKQRISDLKHQKLRNFTTDESDELRN